ncbi:MAG: hypothetical protein V8K32_03755 [Candidatus Electrothrix gigas]
MYKSRVKGTVIFGLLVATFLLIERNKELLAAGWKWYLRKRIECRMVLGADWRKGFMSE